MAEARGSGSGSFESPVVKAYPAGSGSGSGSGGSGSGGSADLNLADVSSTAKTILRAAPGTAAAAGIGVAFGASRSAGDALVCGQRPGEWVLLGSAAGNQAVIDGLDLSGFVSVIEYTHSRALFRLSGTAAASVLEKVCSLDFSDAMTPDGAVTSASLAGVTCDIIRNDSDGERSYLIVCDRSFGQYLFDAILDAGHEFAIHPAA